LIVIGNLIDSRILRHPGNEYRENTGSHNSAFRIPHSELARQIPLLRNIKQAAPRVLPEENRKIKTEENAGNKRKQPKNAANGPINQKSGK